MSILAERYGGERPPAVCGLWQLPQALADTVVSVLFGLGMLRSLKRLPVHHLCERTGFTRIGNFSFYRAPALLPACARARATPSCASGSRRRTGARPTTCATSRPAA